MANPWHKDHNGYAVLDFGKYGGKALWDIPTSYLKWMCREHADNESFTEALILEVEEELTDRGEEIPSGG